MGDGQVEINSLSATHYPELKSSSGIQYEYVATGLIYYYFATG